MQKKVKSFILAFFLTQLTACAYNPFSGNNHATGSATGVLAGTAIGAGSAALLHAPKSIIALAGIGGGAIGYYMTTLRYDAGGVIQAGGQVYQLGDFVGIDIPTDNLFEPNTADFLPQAEPILDSVADILKRNPNNNILISGNTSGFARPHWERRLSQERAKKVAAYLWNAGINQFKEPSNDMRRLTYVGYGSYFPIANDHSNKGIRANSHLQITSYPSACDLHLDKRHAALRNIGGSDDSSVDDELSCPCYSKECVEGIDP